MRREQDEDGSGEHYARVAERGREVTAPDALTPLAADHLRERDAFHLATVGATGWPYVQFRGGVPGFLHVPDPHTVAWADYRGNQQHISTGNLRTDDRVALIAVDHPQQRRLKLFGRARVVHLQDDPEAVLALHVASPDDDGAVVERGVFVTVEAYDWNCPQHITPRWSAAELEPRLAPLRRRVAELEAENARLRAGTGTGT
ncbi:pyridoxamine 5'-phosphate oxidase family protein [Kineococcus siccus]|uniref:pyridoxamine 5'-phosphate oxidase family protein n=1 Tax=Kineococcus siccus TaxID=2696567 RepID=UPI003B82E61F